MRANKHNSEDKNKAFLVKRGPLPVVSREKAEQLQRELDHLALLLDEVKRQTERVEAAADAIGDALISQLYIVADGKERRTTKPDTASTARRALRSSLHLIRPLGLERAQR